MKRQTWKMILCIVLLYCTLGMPGPSAKADSLYVKKIVSVVLDDSGSMSNGNWEYALFSLQNLAAMLNPGDKLFVTRLNRGRTAEYDVTDAGLEASLRKIRTQPNPTGNTDISAVVKAEEHLQKQKSVDDSTEYWLMVLTDGEFTGFQGMQYSNLEDTFRGFLNQTMPNGSRPKVVYLNIAGQHNVQSDEEHGLYAY